MGGLVMDAGPPPSVMRGQLPNLLDLQDHLQHLGAVLAAASADSDRQVGRTCRTVLVALC